MGRAHYPTIIRLIQLLINTNDNCRWEYIPNITLLAILPKFDQIDQTESFHTNPHRKRGPQMWEHICQNTIRRGIKFKQTQLYRPPTNIYERLFSPIITCKWAVGYFCYKSSMYSFELHRRLSTNFALPAIYINPRALTRDAIT